MTLPTEPNHLAHLLLRLAILTTVVAITLPLTGIWWWALLGMDEAVGGAVMFTTGVFAIGASAVWAIWTDTK